MTQEQAEALWDSIVETRTSFEYSVLSSAKWDGVLIDYNMWDDVKELIDALIEE